MLRFVYLLAVFSAATCVKVTFKNVMLTTLQNPLINVSSSNNLKENLPKNFIHSVIVHGKISVLRENSASHIDNVQDLIFLENDIEEIEPGAFKNSSIKSLFITSSNNITKIHGGVFDKLNLEELKVTYTSISNVTKSTFGELPHLLRLTFANNKLANVEEGAFDHLTSLQIVDLSHNKLSILPLNIFGKLSNLQTLILQNNNIQETNFGNLSARQVDLSLNSLTTIPETLVKSSPYLVGLYIAFNKLTSIPSGVFNKQNVQQLVFNNNEISSIDAEAFDDMPNLVNVDLSVNKITQYNPRWFHNTPNIYRLFLSNNLLEELPDEAFKNIYNNKRQWVKLDSNKITKISPNTFKGFKKINSLGLANNKISVWNDKFLEDAEVVDFLNLLGNKITCPEGDFDHVFKANETYLDQNPLTAECLEKIEAWKKGSNRKISTRIIR